MIEPTEEQRNAVWNVLKYEWPVPTDVMDDVARAVLNATMTPVAAMIGSGDEFIDIVFDGPVAPLSGRFIEVETPDGSSSSVGEWVKREDNYWVLRIQLQKKGEDNE